MTPSEFDAELQKIVKRLEQIADEDKLIIDPEAAQPIIASYGELVAFGERVDERKRLNAEMLALATEYHGQKKKS